MKSFLADSMLEEVFTNQTMKKLDESSAVQISTEPSARYDSSNIFKWRVFDLTESLLAKSSPLFIRLIGLAWMAGSVDALRSLTTRRIFHIPSVLVILERLSNAPVFPAFHKN